MLSKRVIHLPLTNMPTLCPPRPIRHQLRGILLKHSIRHPPFRFPSSPLLDATERPHPNTDGDRSNDGAEDSNLGAMREAVEALGDALGRWSGQNLQSGRVPWHGLDGLPCPGCVAVFVLASGGEIGYANGLHKHRVRALVVINLPASPLNGVITIILVPACPDAYADIHRRLRVARSAIRIGVRQRTHDGSIDIPF